jgi:hypothetical protein
MHKGSFGALASSLFAANNGIDDDTNGIPETSEGLLENSQGGQFDDDEEEEGFYFYLWSTVFF